MLESCNGVTPLCAVLQTAALLLGQQDVPQLGWCKRLVLPQRPFPCRGNALLLSYACEMVRAPSQRTRTSVLARPHDTLSPCPRIKWSPVTDSHRRIPVYKTGPVAAEA